MSTKSRWINGALVFFDSFGHRLLDAFGNNVHKYIEDFIALPVDDTTGDPTGWNVAVVEAGDGDSTMSLVDAQGGVVKLQAAGNENDGYNTALKGESWKLTTDDVLYFGAKIKLDEATQSDFMIGLAVSSESMLAGVTDGVYFRKVDGVTSCKFVSEKDSTETESTAMTVAAATWYTVEFYFDGSGKVYAYVDGVLVATHTTNVPDDEELTVSIAYLNGAAQASKGLYIDWIRCIQIMN